MVTEKKIRRRKDTKGKKRERNAEDFKCADAGSFALQTGSSASLEMNGETEGGEMELAQWKP